VALMERRGHFYVETGCMRGQCFLRMALLVEGPVVSCAGFRRWQWLVALVGRRGHFYVEIGCRWSKW
jgi:hypothetical protein